MSGTTVVRYLLATNAPLIAVVPADRIQCGMVPLDIDYPSISVMEISSTQLNPLAMNSASYLITERVQVTVLAKDTASSSGYDLTKSILALVRTALPLSKATINGVACQAIVPDAEGPDLYDHEDLIYSQSQDFIVRFTR